MNVHELGDNGTTNVLYLSHLSFTAVHLNLYKNHFSFIKNINTYTKRFQCDTCDRIFDRSDYLMKHQNVCSTEIPESYSGSKLRPSETIFDMLEKVGIVVPKEDRFYPYISVFDYESILRKEDSKIHGHNFRSAHVPLSYSICSNILDHTDVVHALSEGYPQKLVDSMVEHQPHPSKNICVNIWIGLE